MQHILFCLLGIMALTKIADADETDFGKKKPSTNQVIEALSPAAARPDDANYEIGKSRSIDMSSLDASTKPNKKKIKKTKIGRAHV
jgi:hypothetical protein